MWPYFQINQIPNIKGRNRFLRRGACMTYFLGSDNYMFCNTYRTFMTFISFIESTFYLTCINCLKCMTNTNWIVFSKKGAVPAQIAEPQFYMISEEM